MTLTAKIPSNALVQGSPEWLETRRNMIGASDAPVIMKKSPWSTPYQLWEEKMGLRKSKEISPAMRRGLDLEESARQCFIKETNIHVSPAVRFHDNLNWMMASLDGLSEDGKSVVEIKCANKDDHALAVQGRVPEKYHFQLQHQLEVAGLDSMYYFSFDGQEGAIVEVARNASDIKEMLIAETEFYQNIKDFLPPNLDVKDFQERNDPVWLARAQEWTSIQSEMKLLENRQKELKEELVRICDNQNCMGGGITISKTVRKGNIDYAKIPELQGKNLEQYRKSPIEFWSIR